MKIMKKKVVLLIGIICVGLWTFTPAAYSEMSNYELEQEIKSLRKKLEEQEAVARPESLGKLLDFSDRFSFSGAIGIEGFVGDNFAGDDESDIALATVELGIDVVINEWVTGHVLLLWEEDDTEPLDVDEGTITIGDTSRFPLYLTAGKLYVPFGNFESNMIQDPLTLEMGETRESAVQIGFEGSGCYGSIYMFNGDIGETNDNDKVECYGASIGYALETEEMGMDIGLDWISNISDSDGLTDALDDYAGIDEINDYVSGMAAHMIFNMGPFVLIGEYVTALDEYEDGELDFDGEGAEPESWNIEVAFTQEIMGRETVFALGYQGTDEALGLPEERYLVAIGVELFENTGLTLEYFHDEDYSSSKGGTSENANVVTAQLAVEF